MYIQFRTFVKITRLSAKDCAPFEGADIDGKTSRAARIYLDKLNVHTINLLPF